MNQEPKDALDQAIDEALGSMVSGEPHRVDAASVRQALQPRARVNLPLWLAVAAVLIVGFLLSARTGVQKTPDAKTAASGSVAPDIKAAAGAQPQVLDPHSIQVGQPSSRTSTHRLKRHDAAEALSDVPDPLPYLAIASLTAPEPLVALSIPTDFLDISRIEIPPLSIPAIPAETDRNPPSQ